MQYSQIPIVVRDATLNQSVRRCRRAGVHRAACVTRGGTLSGRVLQITDPPQDGMAGVYILRWNSMLGRPWCAVVVDASTRELREVWLSKRR